MWCLFGDVFLLTLSIIGINNFSDLFEFAKYPLNIFNPIFTFLFKSIVPIGFIQALLH